MPRADQYFGTKFEGAYFLICCTDWNHSTYGKETEYLPFVFLPHKQTSACVYKTFMRTDQSGRNIQCSIRFMLQQAKTWKEMPRVQVPISKHSQTAILWTYQSPSKKNNTPSNSISHGQEVRNLAQVPYWQCTCPSPSAHLLGTFGHGNTSIPPLRVQNYSTIRLLTLCVKFDGIWWRTPELKHLPWTAFIRCIWEILLPIKAPFVKTMLLFWSLHFLSAFFHKISSNLSGNMLKYKQSHIFISPCRNDPSQLQNCRTFLRRYFTIFGTLRRSGRWLEEILSPVHTSKQSIFCLFFASSNVSFGLIHEALHCFNGCAKIWSAPGRVVLFLSNITSIEKCFRFKYSYSKIRMSTSDT